MPLAETIRDELVKVFTADQADVLAHCVVRAQDALATRSDMHELRVAMTELATQQKETSDRVSELAVQQKETSARVSELAAQQKETSARVSELAAQQKETSARVSELATQQKETSAELKQLASTVKELAQQQKETTAEIRELASTVRTLSIRTDTTAGWALEWLVGKHLPAYVGRQIRRCRIIGAMDVIESLEQDAAAEGLSAEEFDQLRRIDLIATGAVDSETVYLVGEVSFTADNDDVLRAARRTAILQKVGRRSQAFVACDAISPISAEMARREGVWVIVKGRLLESAA